MNAKKEARCPHDGQTLAWHLVTERDPNDRPRTNAAFIGCTWLAERAAARPDPYAALDAHVISVKALFCEDGCGRVGTSGYGNDRDAADELAQQGWVVRPYSLGGLTALCKDCAAAYDAKEADRG